MRKAGFIPGTTEATRAGFTMCRVGICERVLKNMDLFRTPTRLVFLKTWNIPRSSGSPIIS